MADNPFLQLVNIQKQYDDGNIACSNININIDKGKFVTILGPSGCGKTTLLKMIAGFEMPSQGKIIVNGIDIKDLPIHLRPTATVFQDYALFPSMTIYENIIYGLKIMRTPLDHVPDKVLKEQEKVRKAAVEKAHKQIELLKQDQVKLDKEIFKAKLGYNKNEDIFKIQDMRYAQFETEVLRLEKKMAKIDPDFDTFKMTAKNQRRVLNNRIKWRLGIHKFVKFDTEGMSKYEKQIYSLCRLYIYKQHIDAKVDKLLAQYNDKDQWISYWQNYPDLVTEQFQKQNTTRLLTKQEIDAKAKEAIELVGLTGYENKYPKELSGGMQQRVALARAIVVKPDILLLDEPLSALDAKVRHKMQEELKRIHNELKINFILVTHDQEEALRLSDQIIVMSKGKVEQFGTAKSIYEHPANAWVANFIGQANFIDCLYLGYNQIKIDNNIIDYQFTNKQLETQLTKNSTFKLLVRPEDVEVCTPEDAYLMVKVNTVLYKGVTYDVFCQTKDKTNIKLQSIEPMKVGETIGVKWNFKYTTPILKKKGDTQ